MDTHRRSVVKGLTWRALAMTDTVLLALIFTGSLNTALSIGGLELITKVVWYYLHERLWVWIPSEHERYPRLEQWLGRSRQTRSIVKAVSWRFFGAVDTFLIALFFTGEVGVSSAIGGAELFTKIILYYLHDRAWSHVHWGKHHDPAHTTNTSRLKDLVEVFRHHYRIGAAVFYGILCVLFIFVSAGIIYGLNELVNHTPPAEILQALEVE